MDQVVNDKILFENIKEASLLLRALNNRIRQQMLKLLEEHHRLTVTEIIIHLRLLQSIASQHLSLLRRQRIVLTKREGKNIYYALNPDRLQEVNKFVESLLV